MVARAARPVRARAAEWLAAGPLLLRMAARRPASWMAAGLAYAAVSAGQPLVTMAVAALATLAAAGDFSPPGMSRCDAGWFAARLVWPLAGMTIGLVATPTVAAPALSALVLTAVSLWTVRQAGAAATIDLTPADTVSLGMVTAAAAVSVGSMTDSWLLAAATWGVLLPVGPCVVWWLHDAADAPLPRATSDLVPSLLSRVPIRRFLGRAAMVTMLAAMVGWLLLDPTQAGWAAALAVASMLSLAGPVAAFQDGTKAAAGSPWDMVWRSTPGGRLLGGGGSLAVETVIRHVAILGWPSLVAAAVAVGTPTGPWPALLVAASLLATAGLMVAVVVVCRGLSLSGDTVLAAVLTVAAAALLLLPMAVSTDIAAIRLNLPDFPW
jgi:hypothetical protein